MSHKIPADQKFIRTGQYSCPACRHTISAVIPSRALAGWRGRLAAQTDCANCGAHHYIEITPAAEYEICIKNIGKNHTECGVVKGMFQNLKRI
jgi:hypothetical protein